MITFSRSTALYTVLTFKDFVRNGKLTFEVFTWDNDRIRISTKSRVAKPPFTPALLVYL